MNRTFALLASTLLAGTLGAVIVLAAANPAGAHRYYGPRGMYFGQQRIYPPPPWSRVWRETPTFAPDVPPSPNYDNPGIPDHHLGNRG
jgi:hypothetical protein